jgi:hypothetical protein
MQEEAECVEAFYQAELDHWNHGNYQVKLLILGEAPLSCDKYFYGRNRGNYLSGLRTHLGVTLPNLLSALREKGILAIDLYQEPRPTFEYDNDLANTLYDQLYVKDRIDELSRRGLLSDSAQAVYRYKKLITRGLNIGVDLENRLIRDGNGAPISLFNQERPNQQLGQQMIDNIDDL